MKTKELRTTIQERINPVVSCYYRTADPDAVFPHSVYDFETIDLGDLSRDDLILVVDLWDFGTDTTRIEEFADQIEALFNNVNLPGEKILPTFYRISRKPIDDENKKIIRRQLKFQIQNYEIGG